MLEEQGAPNHSRGCRNMEQGKILGIAIGTGLVGLLLWPWWQGSAPGEREAPPALAEGATDPVAFVHLFEWTWQDIAQECETVLGPQGFGAVQISPPQEHVVLADQGYPWWQRYQPVSYQLESRSGSRSQLAAMVRRCRAAGVAVYADAVINHMAGVEAGIGSAGTRFTKYAYPGLYGPEDFHPCRQSIDYQNADTVTQCELVGLADLRTASPQVQANLTNYLRDLIGLGIAGFRIDAAKHIRAQEVGAILEDLGQSPPLFIYQEVIDPGNEAIRKQDYYPHGRVLEFAYGAILAQALRGDAGQSLAALQTLGEGWGLAPSDRAVVFIDNHDKQRGHAGGGDYLTYRDGDRYILANVFMLAFPYGTPQVMSSYAFDHPDQGPPSDGQGHTQSVYRRGESGCFDAWVCEHRWPAIAAMVTFRRVTQPVGVVTDWWSDGPNQIAFGRGDRGFVVINGDTAPLHHTWITQLPPGHYCNVLQGGPPIQGKGCPGEILTVEEQGRLTASVAGLSALAVHVGATSTSPRSAAPGRF